MNFLTTVAGPLASAFTWQLVKDSFSAVLGRVLWPVVFERLLTRLVVAGLRGLQRLSTNDVVDETVELIITMLEQKRLAKLRESES